MTIKEKLLQEFECAINSCYGEQANTKFIKEDVIKEDIDEIAQKVKFYLGVK